MVRAAWKGHHFAVPSASFISCASSTAKTRARSFCFICLMTSLCRLLASSIASTMRASTQLLELIWLLVVSTTLSNNHGMKLSWISFSTGSTKWPESSSWSKASSESCELIGSSAFAFLKAAFFDQLSYSKILVTKFLLSHTINFNLFFVNIL